MKTFTASIVALATLAGAASAATPADINEIRSHVPNADVVALTDAEVLSLLAVIRSSDSEGEKRSTLRSILSQ